MANYGIAYSFEVRAVLGLACTYWVTFPYRVVGYLDPRRVPDDWWF